MPLFDLADLRKTRPLISLYKFLRYEIVINSSSLPVNFDWSFRHTLYNIIVHIYYICTLEGRGVGIPQTNWKTQTMLFQHQISWENDACSFLVYILYWNIIVTRVAKRYFTSFGLFWLKLLNVDIECCFKRFCNMVCYA